MAKLRLGSIVLAGGRSRRMGRPKESLPFRGTTLLGHTVDVLCSCTAPVVVVARDRDQELPPLSPSALVTFDARIDDGPLRGIQAGLEATATSCDAVFVTGCDSPFLTAEAVAFLAAELGDHDLVMADVDGRLQPLGAVYRTTVRPTVTELLDAGTRTPRTLADFGSARILSEPEIDAFDPTRAFLRNVNDVDSYERALDEAEPSDTP